MPDIKRGNFSEDEEYLIIKLHKLLGNRYGKSSSSPLESAQYNLRIEAINLNNGFYIQI